MGRYTPRKVERLKRVVEKDVKGSKREVGKIGETSRDLRNKKNRKRDGYPVLY